MSDMLLKDWKSRWRMFRFKGRRLRTDKTTDEVLTSRDGWEWKLSAVFACADELPKRSDPLTPRADCFRSLRRAEGRRFSSAFIVTKKEKKKKKTTATPGLCTCSHKTLNIQSCRHAAVSQGEIVATFKFADIRARHGETILPAEPVCYLAAICNVHFLCLLGEYGAPFITALEK